LCKTVSIHPHAFTTIIPIFNRWNIGTVKKGDGYLLNKLKTIFLAQLFKLGRRAGGNRCRRPGKPKVFTRSPGVFIGVTGGWECQCFPILIVRRDFYVSGLVVSSGEAYQGIPFTIHIIKHTAVVPLKRGRDEESTGTLSLRVSLTFRRRAGTFSFRHTLAYRYIKT
jgi:hypothetical protein